MVRDGRSAGKMEIKDGEGELLTSHNSPQSLYEHTFLSDRLWPREASPNTAILAPTEIPKVPRNIRSFRTREPRAFHKPGFLSTLLTLPSVTCTTALTRSSLQHAQSGEAHVACIQASWGFVCERLASENAAMHSTALWVYCGGCLRGGCRSALDQERARLMAW